MKKFAVLGDPIGHSLSPIIHNLFSKQTGIELTYEALKVSSLAFEKKVYELFEAGYDGLNITLPHKNLAFKQADTLSSESKEIQAVNTLWVDNKKINGHTTDGEGFISDLRLKSLQVRGQHILIIGAGSAARSIIPFLLNLLPSEVTIINRTQEKAVLLARYFQNSTNISGRGFDSKSRYNYDAIINTSSHEALGTSLHISDNIFEKDQWVYDLMYSEKGTHFIQQAKAKGIKNSFDGIGMLVAQASLSFKIWTGVKPEVESVIDKMLK